MNFKTKLKYSLAVLGVSLSVSAHADLYIYGFSNFNQSNGLSITTSNGNFFAPISDSGWWTEGAGHRATNDNYIAGICSDCTNKDNHNNYFTFDLSNIDGTVTSASLNLFNYEIVGTSVEYQLFDITSSLSDVRADGGGNNPIYDDLMSGINYGSIIYNNTDSNQFSTISLNADGIFALNSAINSPFEGQFGIGGTITGGIPGIPPVPEPETYIMLLAGLGLVGFMIRRRRQEKQD